MQQVFRWLAGAAVFCGTLPAWACSIDFTAPADNAIVTTSTVTVSGTASGFANPSAVGSATATVNGRVFFSQTGTFTTLINFFGSGSATATLDPGVNVLVVTGSVSGCSASDTITVLYEPPPSQPNPAKNTGSATDRGNCPAGNPCDPATGNKVQRETDYRAAQRLPLTLERVYNSAATAPGSLATGWTAWWDRSVRIASATATTASLQRPDGKVLRFTLSAGAWAPDGDVNHRLVEIGAGAARTGWRVISSENHVESYDVAGLLTSVNDAAGQELSLTYSDAATPVAVAPRPGLPIRIADAFGRQLNFVYDSGARIASVTDPQGQTYRYNFGANNTLISVEAPSNAGVGIRRYFYNEAARINNGAACVNPPRVSTHALTGIEDEAATRFANFSYDCRVRAVSTEHAGSVDRYAFAYTVDAAGTPLSTAITDPLGTVRTRSFATSLGVPRGTTITEPCATPGCSGSASETFTRDVRGNIASHNDFNGNRTCFAFETARNLETARVEGLVGATLCSSVTGNGATLPAGSRKFSTQWHPDWRLPIRLAEPRKITTWVYHSQPDPFNGNAPASCAPADALLPGGLPVAVVCRRVEQSTTDATGAQGFAAITGNGLAGNATPDTRTWAFTYNRRGQLLSEDGPRTDVADIATYSYYADTVSSGGAEHTLGDLQSVTNALGQTTQFTRYNAHGQVLRMLDANGVATAFTYDARQRLSSRTEADGTSRARTTTFTHDARGLLTRVDLPAGVAINAAGAGGAMLGRSFTFNYDAAHRLSSIDSASGERVTYVRDALGNVTREEVLNSTALGGSAQLIRREFDALGRLWHDIRIVGGLDRVSTVGYDAQGNPTTLARPLEAVYGEASAPLETRRYNVLHQLTQVEDALNGLAQPTVLTPDARDQLSSVRATNNATTTFQRDGFDQVLLETGPDRAGVAYTYDAAGNLKTLTDARGVTVTYAYDSLNRIAAVVHTKIGVTDTSEDQAYTWDNNPGGPIACSNGIGQVCRIVDASGVIHLAYDVFGNLTQQRAVEAGVDRLLTQGYDGENRLSAIDASSGKAVATVRDAEGRADKMLGVLAGVATEVVKDTVYRGDSQSAATTLGNNVGDTRTFDAGGQQVQIADNGIDPGGSAPDGDIPTAPEWALILLGLFLAARMAKAQRVAARHGTTLRSPWIVGALLLFALASAHANETLQHDARGNVQARTVDGQASTYRYDKLDRLNAETGVASQSIGLDANANRTGDAQAAYTVLANGNRLVTRNGVALSYDPAGNLLSDQTRLNGASVNRSFTYGMAGYLKTVSVNGALVATYTHNALGQRTRKVLANPAAGTPATTLYRHDAQGRLFEELAGSAASAAGITVSAGQSLIVYVWKDDVPSAVIYAPNSPANPNNAQERIVYLHTDHLNTPRKATDANARVVWTWNSDAYGSTAPVEDPDADGRKTVINLRFAGQYFDAESGLHQNWHRYYDPQLGRYTQADRIGLAGGINPYGYVEANPLGQTDRTGLCPICVLVLFGLAVNEIATSDVPILGGSGAKLAGRALQSAQQCAAMGGRGLGAHGGTFSSATNAAGGEVLTSVGKIAQNDFATYVNSGLYRGNVNIISGVHGTASGTTIPAMDLFRADVARFGGIPGVRVFNFADMAPGQLTNLLRGPGTTIGGFCDSGACLAPFR